jgi:AraC-like DNA-binding protein
MTDNLAARYAGGLAHPGRKVIRIDHRAAVVARNRCWTRMQKVIYEKVVPPADSSFAVVDKRAQAFDGTYHFHPEIEITLIERGVGRRVVGDNIASFAPGDLVLLGSNLPHQYVTEPQSRQERPPESPLAAAKVIQFLPDIFTEALLRLPELARIAAMLKRSARGLSFGGETAERARETIARLFAAGGSKRLLLLLELLETLSTDPRATPIASAGHATNITPREGDLTDRALQYLGRRYAEPITLAHLCDHLHVAPATCTRLLRKSVGRSFKALLHEIRISHACRMLLETSRPISDAAYGSGFQNLSNFNRRFKHLKGCTPRQYRNLVQQK